MSVFVSFPQSTDYGSVTNFLVRVCLIILMQYTFELFYVYCTLMFSSSFFHFDCRKNPTTPKLALL